MPWEERTAVIWSFWPLRVLRRPAHSDCRNWSPVRPSRSGQRRAEATDTSAVTDEASATGNGQLSQLNEDPDHQEELMNGRHR